MQEAAACILDAIPYLLKSLPVLIVLRLIWAFWLRRRGVITNLRHEAGTVFFLLAAVAIASQTVFPKFSWDEMAQAIAVSGRLPGAVNLKLGRVLVRSYRSGVGAGSWEYFIFNLVGNLGIFLPIGFGIPLLWRNPTLKKTLLIAFGASLFIELCQLPQFRTTDVDDLWLNVLGAALGYGIYALLRRRFGKSLARFRVRREQKHKPIFRARAVVAPPSRIE